MAEDVKQDEAPKKGGKSKLVLILVAVLMLAAGGGGGYFFSKKAASHEPAAEAKADKHGSDQADASSGDEAEEEGPVVNPIVVQLDIFTANIQPVEAEKFLQIGLALKFASKDNKGGTPDFVMPYIPDVRNAILMRLSSVTAQDVATHEGREALREDIRKAVRKSLIPEHRKMLKGILFTTFIMQ